MASAVIEHLPHHPKVEASSPAAAADSGRDNGEKTYNLLKWPLIWPICSTEASKNY
jgi:hypothetical protein